MELSSPQSRTRKHEDDQQNEKPQLKKPNFRRQICSKHVGKTENLRNWLDLPSDLMVSILTRVDAVEVLVTSQFVCTSWRKICKDPLIWRCIDMIYSKYSAYTPSALAHLTKIAVDRSCGQLVDVNLEGFGDDELLRYITDRCPQLRRLRLSYCWSNYWWPFDESAWKFPMLTEIDLSDCYFLTREIEDIGRSCPLLKSFKFTVLKSYCYYYDIDDDSDSDEELHQHCEAGYFKRRAFAIAANMPGLHHLILPGNPITKVGLQAILDGCSHLVSLDIRGCRYIKLDGDLGKRCREQIQYLRGPEEDESECSDKPEEGFICRCGHGIDDGYSGIDLMDDVDFHVDDGNDDDYDDYDDFGRPSDCYNEYDDIIYNKKTHRK